MRPTSRSLAMRDPALAAFAGALPADFGADEIESLHGSEFGVDFGDDEMLMSDYGYEFAADLAAGPSNTAAMVRPTGSEAMQAWSAQRRQAEHTQRRMAILEPNKHSAVKVERYTFAIVSAIVLGTASSTNTTNNPDTNIRPQRVTMNAPQPGFFVVNELKVGNVSVIVGGSVDAFDFNAQGVGQTLDLPTLSPAIRATVAGDYTGFTPPGYVSGTAYKFITSFKGPASVIA